MKGERVVVIGGNHHNTLGLVRSLGRVGLSISLILEDYDKECYVLRSKYIKDYTLAKTEEEVVHTLLSQANERRTVVVCASDSAASIIDKHRSELIGGYYLPGCLEQGQLTHLMNKEVMSELAVKCGGNVPKTVVIERSETDFDNIPFPCITKPISSIEGSKADIAICRDKEELGEYLKHCKLRKVQVQRFVEKTIEYQLIGLINGEVLIPGRSRIITQPKSTNTGYLKYEQLDGSEPLAFCRKFLKRTGYSGLFSMEFIRDKEGNDYFMEINFRNDGNSICVTEAGVNLPFVWYQSCCVPEFRISSVEKKIREIYVMPEFCEINLWYSGQIGFGRMVQELRQADVFMEYAVDDPNPTHGKKDFWKYLFLAVVKKPVRIIIKRIGNI